MKVKQNMVWLNLSLVIGLIFIIIEKKTYSINPYQKLPNNKIEATTEKA